MVPGMRTTPLQRHEKVARRRSRMLLPLGLSAALEGTRHTASKGDWPACFAPLAPRAVGSGQGPDVRRRAARAAWRGREVWRSEVAWQMLRQRKVAESRTCEILRERANDPGGPGSWECMKKRARQGEFGFMGWGGRRRGAGRKPAGE